MAKGYDKDLTAKLRRLTDYAFENIPIDQYEKDIVGSLVGDAGTKRFAAFVTVCNTMVRAQTHRN